MRTIYYNGMYINISFTTDKCYVTDDTGHFYGRMFKSLHGAKCSVTRARNSGVPASR